MKLKATVSIDKSFDETSEFSKNWESKDFQKFFKEEGEYLDSLALVLKDKGKIQDEFTVTYTVKVVKQS